MSADKTNITSGNGSPLIKNGGIGGVTIKGGEAGSHGAAVNLKAGNGGNTIETNEYPGGPTWVDRECDPYFMKLPPDEKFHRFKGIGRWLKKHVLAAVIAGSILAVLTPILVFYTNQWLGQQQEKTSQHRQ